MQLPGWSIDAVSGRYPPGLFALYRGHWCGFAARERIPRLATYLGAKAVKIKDSEVIVRQGRLCLTVKRLGSPGHPLQAPVGGAMTRTIHEHPSCKVYYRFTDGDVTLLELEAPNAAFEYEY